MSEYHHIYLRGNYQQEICYDREDFAQVWNRILLAAYNTRTDILALIILSNHFHMVIKSHSVPSFMHYLRMSITHYFNKKYNVHGTLGTRNYGDGLICDTNTDGADDLMDAICYVLRNCFHHRVMEDFMKYSWSTVRLAFSDWKNTTDSYEWTEVPKVLAGKYLPYPNKLPEGLRMTSEGVILPDQIICHDLVERIFARKTEYFKRLFTETRREREARDKEQKNKAPQLQSSTSRFLEANIKDEEIITFINESIVKMSDRSRDCPKNIMQMTVHEKYRMAAEIKRRYPQCPFRLLSRVLHIPESTLRSVLARSPNI